MPDKINKIPDRNNTASLILLDYRLIRFPKKHFFVESGHFLTLEIIDWVCLIKQPDVPVNLLLLFAPRQLFKLRK